MDNNRAMVEMQPKELQFLVIMINLVQFLSEISVMLTKMELLNF